LSVSESLPILNLILYAKLKAAKIAVVTMKKGRRVKKMICSPPTNLFSSKSTLSIHARGEEEDVMEKDDLVLTLQMEETRFVMKL